MILINTKVKVSDNSGARIAECIRILRQNKKLAHIGDTIVVAIKTAYFKKKVKKHEVRFGLVVRRRKKYKRFFGYFIHFSDNAVVILDKKKQVFCNRFFGPATQELRLVKQLKLISTASATI